MANLSNINNKFLVTTGGYVLIGQTSAVGSSILQVTKMICEGMNKNFDDVVEYVDDRPFQDPSYNSVNTKLRDLGWTPKRTLKDQLPAIVEWTKNNREFFSE